MEKTSSGRESDLLTALDHVGKRGFAYAWQLLRHHEDALDAVQAALASVWQHRGRIDPERGVRGWFFRILRNKCLDVLRRRKQRTMASLEFEPAGPGSFDPAVQATESEALVHLRATLESLPSDQREILLLRDYHDLTYAEIAETLNIPTGTVMSRLHRARLALREKMLAPEVGQA